MNRTMIVALSLLAVLSLGCSGGSDDDDDDDDGGTPDCEANLTGTFSMTNGGNVAIDLYVDGGFEETLSIGETVEVTLSAPNVHDQETYINGGPLDGNQACLPDSFALDVCEDIGPINCSVNI